MNNISFLDYYKNAPDLNAPAEEHRRADGSTSERFNRTGMRSDFTRLFINLGSVDGFGRGDLLGYICNTSKISGRTVGKIDVKGVYSFFEVPNEDVEKVQSGFKGADFQGRDVRIEISGEGSSHRREDNGGNRRREGGNSYSGGGRREGRIEGLPTGDPGVGIGTFYPQGRCELGRCGGKFSWI